MHAPTDRVLAKPFGNVSSRPCRKKQRRFHYVNLWFARLRPKSCPPCLPANPSLCLQKHFWSLGPAAPSPESSHASTESPAAITASESWTFITSAALKSLTSWVKLRQSSAILKNLPEEHSRILSFWEIRAQKIKKNNKLGIKYIQICWE